MPDAAEFRTVLEGCAACRTAADLDWLTRKQIMRDAAQAGTASVETAYNNAYHDSTDLRLAAAAFVVRASAGCEVPASSPLLFRIAVERAVGAINEFLRGTRAGSLPSALAQVACGGGQTYAFEHCWEHVSDLAHASLYRLAWHHDFGRQPTPILSRVLAPHLLARPTREETHARIEAFVRLSYQPGERAPTTSRALSYGRLAALDGVISGEDDRTLIDVITESDLSPAQDLVRLNGDPAHYALVKAHIIEVLADVATLDHRTAHAVLCALHHTSLQHQVLFVSMVKRVVESTATTGTLLRLVHEVDEFLQEGDVSSAGRRLDAAIPHARRLAGSERAEMRATGLALIESFRRMTEVTPSSDLLAATLTWLTCIA
ncbi:MAG: hypothetical protein M0T84_07170 [Betaproteobacteria bacterium]|nr:hypothetical protein [Betaproteobacteria bacterium]